MSEFTVGIEEEYQLIDPRTADLRSSSRAVRGSDWSGDLRRELQESTIEIGTAVSATSGGALSELRRLRAQAATAAAVEDLAIAAAGLHPFSEWRGHEMTAGKRYAQMAEVYGRIARDEHNFGMHIHVAPGAGADRIEVQNAVRRYVPHLLALSCSSPYFEGEDTGYASYRMVLWRRWPGAGVPPRLRSEAEYREYIDIQLRAGVHRNRSAAGSCAARRSVDRRDGRAGWRVPDPDARQWRHAHACRIRSDGRPEASDAVAHGRNDGGRGDGPTISAAGSGTIQLKTAGGVRAGWRRQWQSR